MNTELLEELARELNVDEGNAEQQKQQQQQREQAEAVKTQGAIFFKQIGFAVQEFSDALNKKRGGVVVAHQHDMSITIRRVASDLCVRLQLDDVGVVTLTLTPDQMPETFRRWEFVSSSYGVVELTELGSNASWPKTFASPEKVVDHLIRTIFFDVGTCRHWL